MCTGCGKPLSIGLISNAAEIYPELVRRGVIPDMVTGQTSAHDALNGYIPADFSLTDAAIFPAFGDKSGKDLPQEEKKRILNSIFVS